MYAENTQPQLTFLGLERIILGTGGGGIGGGGYVIKGTVNLNSN